MDLSIIDNIQEFLDTAQLHDDLRERLVDTMYSLQTGNEILAFLSIEEIIKEIDTPEIRYIYNTIRAQAMEHIPLDCRPSKF